MIISKIKKKKKLLLFTSDINTPENLAEKNVCLRFSGLKG